MVGSRAARSGSTRRTSARSALLYYARVAASSSATGARREVHRRRGDGPVRRTHRTRGRPERAVRAALAIWDWARRAGELQVRIGITTGEALVALGAARAQARAWPRATSSTRRPGCKQLPRERHPGRRDDLPRHRAGDRLPRGRSRSRRRARPSQSRRGGASARIRVGVGARPDGLVGREHELELVREHSPASSRGATPARHPDRRTRDRKEPTRIRALPGEATRSGWSLAPGPVTALRRGRHALGARRDRQGAGPHPRDDEATSDESSPRGHEAARGGRRRADQHNCALVGLEADGAAAATGGTRPSQPGGDSSRRWPSSGRSCSCSRTSIGPTTPCSTSSTTWSNGRRSATARARSRHVPELLARRPGGAEASRTRRR